MADKNRTFRIFIVLMMIMSGAVETLSFYFQNSQMVYEGQFFK
jgi:hypothetical protein